MTKEEAIEFLKKEGMIVKTNFLDDLTENLIVLAFGVVVGYLLAKLF